MHQCSAYVGETNDTVYLIARDFIKGGPSVASSFQRESSLYGPPFQFLSVVRSCFNACREISDHELSDSESMQLALNGLFEFLKVSSWKQLQKRYRCIELTLIGKDIEIMPTKREGGEYIHLREYAKRSELEPNSFRALFLEQLARSR